MRKVKGAGERGERQTQDAVKRGHLHNDVAEFVDAAIYSEASLCIYFRGSRGANLRGK